MRAYEFGGKEHSFVRFFENAPLSLFAIPKDHVEYFVILQEETRREACDKEAC